MAPKEIYAILTETLGEHAPLCATVKNWVAQFNLLTGRDVYVCSRIALFQWVWRGITSSISYH
jgi:hypothetical protein